MLYISGRTRGSREDTITYSIWSNDWKRVHDIELNKEEYKLLCAKKKKITAVSYMEVLSHSLEVSGTGIYATDTETLLELK